MVAERAQHDIGAKTLLNGVVLPRARAPTKDLNDAIDNIFNHPNVGPFIAKQLIQHLVTSNPSPAYVARVAACSTATAAASAAICKAVVRAILLDPEARGDVKTDAELRPAAPSGAVHRQPAARVRRAVGGRQRRERRLPESAERRRWAWTCSGRRRCSATSRPATVVAGHRRRARSGVRAVLDLHGAAPRQLREHDGVLDASPSSANAPSGTSLDLSPLQALAGNPAALVDALNALLLHGTMSTGDARQHRRRGDRGAAHPTR